jgi:hypothetical protein
VDEWRMPEDYNFDAAIVHHNRVCQIDLHYLTRSQLQRLASAMQVQFPALIHLLLDYNGDNARPAPVLSDGFLGGFVPHLQSFELHSIPFPALPKLLPSATDLVRLGLWHIPHSGYFSPEAIVTGLAVLTNLESLTITFRSPQSRPSWKRRRPPPPMRTVLPALTHFQFRGVSEYLEDLVARIDTPLLDSIYLTFFPQLIFDIPQLAQFMRRTTRFQALNEAHGYFDPYGVQLEILPLTRTVDQKSWLRISCRKLDWQLSSLAQAIPSFVPSIYMVEHLYVYGVHFLPSHWQDDMEDMQWLEIFRPFTAVKNLYLSDTFAPRIAHTLQELIGGRITEVLPALERIFLESPRVLRDFWETEHVKEQIGNFVAARQLSGHPLTVSSWERD